MKFFAICPECGSNEWIEFNDLGNNTLNALNEYGEVVVPNDLIKLGYSAIVHKIIIREKNSRRSSYKRGLMCTQCEAPLFPVPFNDTNKALRRKIYFMSDSDKIKWINNYQTLQVLEAESEDG